MPPSSRPLLLAWRCPSCTKRAIRPFSTTGASQAIGPEHPRYIDVPQPVQPDRIPRPRIRGSLPVPRDIFHRKRGGVDKVNQQYLDAVTTKSTKPKTTRKPSLKPESQIEAARQDWKARMSELRRQNLREGLLALQTRRRRFDAKMSARAAAKARQLKEATFRPPPEDERLTATTVTQLMQPRRQRGYRIPDPHREERIAAMRVRVQAKEDMRRAARLADLQDLYMNARSFIVSEQQLEQAIEEQFGTTRAPARFGFNGTSIWHASVPQSVTDKMNSGTRAVKAPYDQAVDDPNSYENTLNRRMKKIAKELTGGTA